ncbi:MAG: cytochrome P450 [Aggregatilineales bacterium]
MIDNHFPPGPTNNRQALLRLSRDPIAFFLEMMQTYGEFSYVRVGSRDTYVICDPALLQRVYIEEVEVFDKDDHTKLSFAPAGQGLFVLSGAEHRQHRRTLQPLFTPIRVAEYADTVLTHTERMLKDWQAGQVHDLETDIAGLTMGIVCEAIFGIQSDSLRAEFAEAIAVFQQHSAESRYRSHFSDDHKARYQAAIAAFDRIVREVLAQKKPNGRDFLSLMANATDPETGQKMSDQEIMDEARTLLMAGYETTANALLWTWYLVGKHPDIETRVFDEVYRVADSRQVTHADLPKLELLTTVFKESLRLYPPAWLMGRRVTEPVDLGGYRLPTDAVLAISPYVIHRNPKYFPEPEAFRPERFEVDLPKYTYLPFGLGPHICLGQHFATMEALLILANVAQRFRLSLPTDYVAEPEGLGTLKPKTKILVTLEDRVAAPAKVD